MNLKHAWAVLGLSLFAGTASAAIPDANGVIHGCYNTLTGSTRIIDGNNCGLLERNVNWSQTGPRGPAGASVAGVSLPVGDPSCPAGGVALTLSGTTSYVCNGLPASNDIEVGTDTLRLQGPIAADSQVVTYVSSGAFTPRKTGVCTYNFTSRFLDPVDGVTYTPTLRFRQTGVITLSSSAAVYSKLDATLAQGATTAGWFVDAGTDYTVGVTVNTRGSAIPAHPSGSAMEFVVTWVCSGGPSST